MAPTPVAPQAFLPLRPLELLILVMLGERPMHGYALWQAIVEHTDGSMLVEAGNLYRHIRRLETETLIEVAPNRRGADAPQPRREFRLTPLGRRVLAAELERLRTLLRLADQGRLVARTDP